MVQGQADRAGSPCSQTDVWATQDGQQDIQVCVACSAGFRQQQLAAAQLYPQCDGADRRSSRPAYVFGVVAGCSSCCCGRKQCPECTASVLHLALHQQLHFAILHCTTAVCNALRLDLMVCVCCTHAVGHDTARLHGVYDCCVCNGVASHRLAVM